MDNFKAKEFLEAIGLGTQVLERRTTNICTFISPRGMVMDDPHTAVYIHLKNLVATYGYEKVAEVFNILDTQPNLKEGVK